jgi:hypothetical protein
MNELVYTTPACQSLSRNQKTCDSQRTTTVKKGRNRISLGLQNHWEKKMMSGITPNGLINAQQEECQASRNFELTRKSMHHTYLYGAPAL